MSSASGSGVVLDGGGRLLKGANGPWRGTSTVSEVASSGIPRATLTTDRA